MIRSKFPLYLYSVNTRDGKWVSVNGINGPVDAFVRVTGERYESCQEIDRVGQSIRYLVNGRTVWRNG